MPTVSPDAPAFPGPTADRPSARVVVLAELNPDVVVTVDAGQPSFGQVEDVVEHATVTLGSSGAITAAALAALGADVAICGVLGDDPLGSITLDLIVATGVNAGAVVRRRDVATGMTVVLSRPDGDRALLTFPGAMASLTGADVPLVMLGEAHHVHVSSFYLQRGLRPSLPSLLRAARAAGATTSLDPGWDPQEKWAAVEDVLPELDYLLPNAAECLRIAGALGHATTDPLVAARALAMRGPDVAVKLGAAGAAFVTTADTVTVAAEPVAVRDTTGAGDNFDAGVLAALLEGHPPEFALAQGVACGSLAVTGVGGTGRLATAREAREIAERLVAAAGPPSTDPAAHVSQERS